MVAVWRPMAMSRKTTIESILKVISKNIENKGQSQHIQQLLITQSVYLSAENRYFLLVMPNSPYKQVQKDQASQVAHQHQILTKHIKILVLMDEDLEEDLNLTMQSLLAIRPSPAKIILRLKFRNTIYSSGDHIHLIQNLQSHEPLYGRVLCIAKIPSLQFPVLLVAWYLTRSDPQIQQHVSFRMSRKQLVLTSQTDWQYVQSVKGKLQVLSEKEFLLLEPRQKENENIFFCRSYLASQQRGLLPQLTRVCQCYVPFNPEETYSVCVCCGLQFHRGCSKQSQICSRCSHE